MKFNFFIAVVLVIAALAYGHDHPLDEFLQFIHVTA